MLPRPRAVWCSVALGVAAVNLWCNHGEPNGDTISENTRALKDATPHGDELLAGILAAIAFWRHICRPRWSATPAREEA